MLREPALPPDVLRGATPERRAAWVVERDRYYRECGCKTGLGGAATGLAIAALLMVAAPGRLGAHGPLAIAVTGAVPVICGAVAGKAIGYARARRRFRRATIRLIAETRSYEAAPNGETRCLASLDRAASWQ